MSEDPDKPWQVVVYILGPFFLVGLVLFALWVISHYLPLDWSEFP